MANYIVKMANETLDEIVYQTYSNEFNYLEEVLQSNPSLANEGVFLTKGLVIILPDLAVNNNVQKRITLWD